MQVSVEKISNVERRLTITVPFDQVEQAYAKKIDRFAKTANIKGFRPGKAPISYIQQRFGNDARQEALSEVIERALTKAITDEKLRPVSTPKIEPKMMQPNQPLEFVASFEVLPEIDNISFSADSIEKFVTEITDEDVQRVIEQLKKQYTNWQVVDREAQEKDRVVIDYYPIFEGQSEVDKKAENFPLELGSQRMFAGFETGLLGAKVGEERTLDLKFPDDFQDKDKAGKPISFVVTVKQIFKPEVPTIDEAFIKKIGVKSGKEETLKEQIKQSLSNEKDRLIREKIKEQIFQKLIEQNPIEVPKSLIAREAKSIHDEVFANQKHEHNHSDDEMAAFNEIAKKRVALGLLISEYAKREHMKADKTRVHQRIQEIASAYEHPQEVIAWLSQDEKRAGIEAQVLEEQVMEKLLSTVNTVEKKISYAELTGIRI